MRTPIDGLRRLRKHCPRKHAAGIPETRHGDPLNKVVGLPQARYRDTQKHAAGTPRNSLEAINMGLRMKARRGKKKGSFFEPTWKALRGPTSIGPRRAGGGKGINSCILPARYELTSHSQLSLPYYGTEGTRNESTVTRSVSGKYSQYAWQVSISCL